MSGRHGRLLAAGVALLLAGLACQLPATTSGQVDPTALAQALIDANNATVVAGLTQTAALPASADLPAGAEGTATPTETATPAETATPPATIPTSPSAQLTENTNCRKGPLAGYDLVITYLNGQLLDILGRNAAGDYWYVANPNNPSANCWLWGRYAQVSGDTGQVPVFTPPPTPTPSWNWAGTWTVWLEASFQEQYSQTLSQNGDQVSGNMVLFGGPETLAGTTSQAGRNVSGAFIGSTITFGWHMLDNGDQFIGNLYIPATDQTFPYCGARNGQPPPAPCLWP